MAGIAVGVALLFASQVANTSLSGPVQQLTRGIVGNSQLQVIARGPDGLPERAFDEIARAAGRAARGADPAGAGQPRRAARHAGGDALRRRPADRAAARLAAAGLQRRRRLPAARADPADADRARAGRALRRHGARADRRPDGAHADRGRRTRRDRRAERHDDRPGAAGLPSAVDGSARPGVADPGGGRAGVDGGGLALVAARRAGAVRRHARRPRGAPVRQGRRADQPGDDDLQRRQRAGRASCSPSARCS